jgi:hypothetical protein
MLLTTPSRGARNRCDRTSLIIEDWLRFVVDGDQHPRLRTAVLTLSRGTSTAGHETVKAGRLHGYARHRTGATEITETRHRLLDVSGAMSPRMQITWMFSMAPKMLATKS